MLLGFSMKFLVAARSQDLCPVNGNRLAPYYMGAKHTGELWVYISTPLPNPSGNTGVMLCYVILFKPQSKKYVQIMHTRAAELAVKGLQYGLQTESEHDFEGLTERMVWR